MILRTFCPFFVFLFVKYLCLPERRFVIGYIYKKEDCDCSYLLLENVPGLLTHEGGQTFLATRKHIGLQPFHSNRKRITAVKIRYTQKVPMKDLSTGIPLTRFKLSWKSAKYSIPALPNKPYTPLRTAFSVLSAVLSIAEGS